MAFFSELKLALRFARRELRGGVRGFGIFLACLALGVGAVAAVGTVSSSVDTALSRDAKALMGGDIQIRQTHVPASDEAITAMESMGRVMRMVSMRSMARPPETQAPQGNATNGVAENAPEKRRSSLVELKAVGPNYPLFGAVTLEPALPLADVLAEKDGVYGAAVEKSLLMRLGLAVGDDLRVGQSVLRIRAEVVREPDRPSNFFGLGPRVLLSLDAIKSTGLLRPGSVVRYVYALGLEPGVSIEQAKERLQAVREPGWQVRDYKSSSPGLSRFFDNLAVYLTLVGLAALLVGGIGVANGVRASLEKKYEAIASLKCLGATRRLVVWTYLAQTMALALLGSVLGVALGVGSAFLAAPLLAQLLTVPVAITPAFKPLALALMYGLLTAMAFALWPLSAAGTISPARLFRGYGEAGPRRPSWQAAMASACCGAGLIVLTLLYAHNARLALGFAGGVLAAMAFFRIAAVVVMRVAARLPRPRKPRLRHAIANIHRPGAATPAVLFSLGLGLTILVTVSQVDSTLQRSISEQLPKDAPSYFFLDIQNAQIDTFRDIVAVTRGITRMEAQPSIRGRITAINGVPVEQAQVADDVRWALRGDRGMTYAATPPKGTKIVSGQWWPADYHGKPLICLDSGLAEGFGVGPGDTITVSILGQAFTPTIACTREIEWSTLSLNHTFVFSPGVLDNAPHSWIATAYTDSKQADDALFETVTTQLPSVVAIYVRDVLQDVDAIVRNIGMAIRLTAAVTLLAGLLVLAQTLAANLEQRYYDAVVFKVLGATRRDILVTLALEFLLLGAVTAAVAALAGCGLAWAFVNAFLMTQYAPLMGPLALILCGGVLATLALGLFGVRHALSKPAWPVLRNE
ncbi:ABC transporter permease [Oceanidesulfovibrio marinus]|uniref:FtsX-like permease family protein n=1 Tax=Oceanidesulfovibrio marinus TaxID=370038 RepID=A0ABX6NM16_9BACT|nr:FtsX-like permease family protein [Oceanidesulfovibrio marinus]QJT10735.1 FtsX-like permease family protein [Oceanidesulfovibrio marinus]